MMIIQIVPQLPPVVNGLGDYGFALAKQIRQDFGVITCFVVGDPNWNGKEELDGFPVKKVTERSAEALVSVIAEYTSYPMPVLLHYVNYGYAQRGCPVWLINGLRQWRLQESKSFLLTMFHEVYATGFPFWTSAFWTEPMQKNLSASLVRISDRMITNMTAYAKMLCKLCPDKNLQIPILPVFSNIGEPDKVLSLTERKKRLVVFGQSGNRLKVYEKSRFALERVCRELCIQEIIDIGSPLKQPVSKINDIPTVSLGQQTAERVSAILQDSLVGFFHYPLNCLMRSSIFAAYCSHGVIPVGTNYYERGQKEDELEANQNYWLADNQAEELSFSTGKRIADKAYAWYQTHNLSKQAQVFMINIFK